MTVAVYASRYLMKSEQLRGMELFSLGEGNARTLALSRERERGLDTGPVIVQS